VGTDIWPAFRADVGRDRYRVLAAEEAGKLVQDLPRLWAGANLGERRKLLLTMLDAVYGDVKDGKRIVAIKPMSRLP
jgi:hypothetical protein